MPAPLSGPRHLLSTSLLGLVVCLAGATDPAAASDDPQGAFFVALQDLCGVRFEGEMTFPADGRDEFAGRLLVAEVETCEEEEIRIPFRVGDDASRTWILSRTPAGLELKHDHRHADGTPDEVTMYGGIADAPGTAFEQSFPADAYTRELLPEAATNVWTLRFSEDRSILTYHLERHGEPRFTAVLTRTD